MLIAEKSKQSAQAAITLFSEVSSILTAGRGHGLRMSTNDHDEAGPEHI